MTPCTIDDCGKPAKTRGWCAMHYWRWLNHGDVHHERSAPTVQQRLERRVVREVESGCWLWSGQRLKGGYGVLSIDGVTVLAHRAAYEVFVGPIPDGLHLDHLCRNRECVNPAHLEPVTALENTLRSPIAPAAINARKTHCLRGHEFTPENTYRRGERGRECRTCMRFRDRRWRDRRAGVKA